MKSKKLIKQFQEFLINSWPAKHYFFLNGWILRFNDGVTSRANSVIPLQYTGNKKTIDNDIELVEKAYTSFNLPAIFTIPEYHQPKNLVSKLLTRGFHKVSPTSTLMCSVQEINLQDINKTFSYEFKDNRVEAISHFLAQYSKRSEEEQKILEELSQRIIIPSKCHIIAKDQDEIIGTLTGILEPHGFLYIADLLTKPNYRRKNVATSIIMTMIRDWANPNGASTLWLQVEKENLIALNLYNKLGFSEAYSYYYLQKDKSQ